uniref:Uncharacterized protein n=1 Tax=Glossina austeni TaxID=7395 RepID=A0A1A9V5D8_GLOAU
MEVIRVQVNSKNNDVMKFLILLSFIAATTAAPGHLFGGGYDIIYTIFVLSLNMSKERSSLMPHLAPAESQTRGNGARIAGLEDIL